jgi:hypothetical protein
MVPAAHMTMVALPVPLHRADHLRIGRQRIALGRGSQRIGGGEPVARRKIRVGKAVYPRRR